MGLLRLAKIGTAFLFCLSDTDLALCRSFLVITGVGYARYTKGNCMAKIDVVFFEYLVYLCERCLLSTYFC